MGRPRNKAMMFTNLPYLYEIDVASALELPQMDGKLSRAQVSHPDHAWCGVSPGRAWRVVT